jgi:hypothetical protein
VLSPEQIAMGVFGLFGVTGVGGMLMAVRRRQPINIRITRDSIILAFALGTVVVGWVNRAPEFVVIGFGAAGGVPIIRGTIDAVKDATNGKEIKP